MARLPLLGGSYVARSVIANAQRCINYYPELNRQDSPTPFTYYQRPGMRPLVSPTNAAPIGRGLYRASNGNGYCVCGQSIYSISSSWVLTELGTLGDYRTNPVSFIDNGTDILLVDGSTLGYSINLATNAFATISDPTGIFNGATRVDVIDTFVIWNLLDTNQFGSTLSNTLTFNALYFAAKAGYPDKLVVPYVNRHEIVLLGTLKSEIWYDAGNAQFPFAILPGAYIEHGTVAAYSPASSDIELFWLSQDLGGDRMVLALKGYDTRRISNHALEEALQNMPRVDDAIGYIYQQGGHVFYVLTFPTADQTWVYDASLGDDPTMAWHQRCWTGSDGLHRDRGMSAALLYGINVVQDWQYGTIYQLDRTQYYDVVNGVESPLSCVKGFPHVVQGWNAQIGQPEVADGRQIQIDKFTADFQVGTTPVDSDGNGPMISLRWSRDRGVSFGTEVLQPAGTIGEYMTQPKWNPVGIARDFVMELQHSIRGPAALNGAWIDATVLKN